MNKVLWIALVEVEAIEGNEAFAPGEKSFVNAVSLARSRETARTRIRKGLLGLRFHVIAFESVESWETRNMCSAEEHGLAALAEVANETGQVQFGTFHTWDAQG